MAIAYGAWEREEREGGVKEGAGWRVSQSKYGRRTRRSPPKNYKRPPHAP